MQGIKTQWGRYFKKDKQWMDYLHEHYEAYNPTKVEPQSAPLIPKIIHQAWLGSPFPEKYKKWQESWQKHHPDWEYILWTDEKVKELKLQNQEAFEKAKSFGTKTDILRYELLYQFGGLYIDTDFECFKPMDIFHHRYSFYCGVLPETVFAVCSGFIASAPRHPILKALLDKITLPKSNYWEAVSLATGPLMTTPIFMNYVSECDDASWMVFPCSYLFPMPIHPKFKPSTYIKPESYALHHYEGSWT